MGVGLIGGSLALALKEAGCVGEVVGCGRGKPNLEKALERGIIDRYERDPRLAAVGADLIFLATPVQTLAQVVAEIAPVLKPGTILTDGGSVKAEVVRQIQPLVPAGVDFVPGHPIAGTEKSGAEAAFADLYRGKRCILTPTATTSAAALQRVTEMWQAVGSEVVCMSVDKHD
ncbi:MAG: prephenate dehydrogenase/arogenate dehydrogenase family protein, partial [Deltaproteobacteria bacterium]|nr:prephenate dehydrogenase/arogenate dehydrogenase family protein [Deltaproteobacteria bacterium]